MVTLPTTNIAIDLEVHRAIEACRASFDQAPNDILREVFDLPKNIATPQKIDGGESGESSAPLTRRIVRTRRTGTYGFTLLGAKFQDESLQASYKRCLLEFSKRDSRFLDRLSDKRTRSRRLVARDPQSLFLKTPTLAKKFAAPLTGPWWFDVNLSQPQVETRIEMACEVAGLQFGGDLTLDFPE
jgi:hypothetical protein